MAPCVYIWQKKKREVITGQVFPENKRSDIEAKRERERKKNRWERKDITLYTQIIKGKVHIVCFDNTPVKEALSSCIHTQAVEEMKATQKHTHTTERARDRLRDVHFLFGDIR
jgi:hypothetical protein